MFRGHPGEHRDVVDATVQFFVGHLVELLTRDRMNLAIGEIQLLTDGGGCQAMITSDHLHLDARLACFENRLACFGSGRVDDANHGQNGQSIDEARRVGTGRHELVPRLHRELALGDGENAHARSGQFVVVGNDRSAHSLDGHGATTFVEGGDAAGQNDIGGTLHEHLNVRVAVPIGDLVHGGHHFQGRIEGDFGQTRVLTSFIVDVDATLEREDRECSFGGITDQGPLVIDLANDGVVAESHRQ